MGKTINGGWCAWSIIIIIIIIYYAFIRSIQGYKPIGYRTFHWITWRKTLIWVTNIHKLPVRILTQLTPWCMLYAVQRIPKYRFQLKLYLQWWLCNLSQFLWQKYCVLG